MRTSARDSVSEASSTESQWCESWSWMLKQRMVWKRKISNETWDIHWKYTSIHEISYILHILHALHAKIAWWLKHQKSRGPRELASFWKASLGQLSFSDYLHAPGKLTRLYKHYQIVISKETHVTYPISSKTQGPNWFEPPLEWPVSTSKGSFSFASGENITTHDAYFVGYVSTKCVNVV